MRYFDFTITPEGGVIHPADKVIADHPKVRREALEHVNALADGTGILLYRLVGPHEEVTAALEAHDSVIAADLLDVEDDVFHLYLHVGPGEPAASLMMLAQQYALMIDTPLEFNGRGSLRTTVVGTHSAVQGAIAELPENISISVEQVGQYEPESGDTLSMLTDRQQEVFRTAVDLGYYEIPRRATHEDIAEALECAPSTVDEHLRKAESRVLSALVG